MDPYTTLLAGAFFALLNAILLAALLRIFPRDLRPSGLLWLAGTASGAAAFFIVGLARHVFAGNLPILVLGNAFALLAPALYWEAARRFDKLPGRWLPYAIAGVGVVVMFIVGSASADPRLRVVVVSGFASVLLAGAAWATLAGKGKSKNFSRRLLGWATLVLACFAALRAIAALVSYVVLPEVAGPFMQSALMRYVSPLLFTLLPVIGTTTVLLMCIEQNSLRLRDAALTDALTGLPNRRHLMNMGAYALGQSTLRAQGIAVVLCDIDHFKRVNDNYGHAVGDIALRHVADIMRSVAAPEGDISISVNHRAGRPPTQSRLCVACRYGGEEFVALVTPATAATAFAFAETLRAAMEERPLSTEQHGQLQMTGSFGVAMVQPSDTDLDTVLNRADTALYVAKSAGRNTVRVDETSV
jgi:GGDEF domain-containing protein